MANIFKAAKDINENPNRCNHDLSRKSNVTLKMGTLYPVFTQPVVPGDSFDIQAAYNLKLNPIIFPIQSKMRAHLHFFYVRNKNLWKNWQNWISNLPGYSNSEHPHPFLSVPDNRFKSGSIHDFLGVPTSLVCNEPITSFITTDPLVSTPSPISHYYTLEEYQAAISDGNYLAANSFTSMDLVQFINFQFQNGNLDFREQLKLVNEINSLTGTDVTSQYGTTTINNPYFLFYSNNNRKFYPLAIAHLINTETGYKFELSQSDLDRINSYPYSVNCSILFQFSEFSIPEITAEANPITFNWVRVSTGFFGYDDTGIDLYSNHLHINALPYRAYESIYNCYYRNNVVDPLVVNGTQKYNEYNTTTDDGADSTDYHLFQRNYELDFLTSALPSPQQGVAPLVGMTALGDVTIEDENGITTAHAEVDNDGTITKVVLTSPAASIEHARTAMNIAASGMSINDFRVTNALTRFVETNIRKGYRYVDFIAGHFNHEPKYQELDMPEFIGGFSRDVNVSTVVSNADTLGDDSGAALGSYAGYASLNDGSKHNIRHYCDDFGYIIGILSVVPTPCYSQLLRKDMVVPDNFLDYYFPEFSQTGLVPIPYREVAPIQSYLDSLTDPSKSLDDTFGYQRPNYDMVSAVDEVHGDFRGSLRNYVINRIFDTRPELGHDFLAINPEEVNDIFVNTNPEDDTLIGEIGFSVHAKRPVPRVVIPNLGR